MLRIKINICADSLPHAARHLRHYAEECQREIAKDGSTNVDECASSEIRVCEARRVFPKNARHPESGYSRRKP